MADVDAGGGVHVHMQGAEEGEVEDDTDASAGGNYNPGEGRSLAAIKEDIEDLQANGLMREQGTSELLRLQCFVWKQCVLHWWCHQ